MANLIQWTPMRDLERIFEDDFLFPIRNLRAPAVDLYETANEVVVEVSIPGMDPKKVGVEIENNVLHLTGNEEDVREEKDKGYYRKEVRRGTFARSLALPVEVEAEKVTASCEKGILKIIMPKAEKAKARKVNVEVR